MLQMRKRFEREKMILYICIEREENNSTKHFAFY